MANHIFSKIEDDFISDNYKYMTLKEISLKLGLTESQVKHRIQRHLKLNMDKRKKYNHNKDFFKSNSGDMFYILGLIYADGNIYDDGRNNHGKVSISLLKSDRYLLEQISSMLCNSVGPVKDRKNENMCELTLYSKEIYNDLQVLGVTERKSLTLTFPNFIEKESDIKHFVRGYFDGDGCFSTTKAKDSTYIKPTFSAVGTEQFLEELSKVLNRFVKVNLKTPEKTKSKIFNLRYTTRQCRSIMDWMYSNDEEFLYLKRKYDKYNMYKEKVQRLIVEPSGSR